MQHISILAALLLLLTGCATSYDEYSENLDWYVGENIQVVIDDMGYPAQVLDMPSGNRVYLYLNEKTRTASREVSDPSLIKYKYDPLTGKIVNSDPLGLTPTRTEYYNVTENCKTWFETDEDNLVVKYKFDGTGCPKDFNVW